MRVVDASVWVSHLTPADSNHLNSLRWIDDYTDSGGELLVPTLLLVEVAGVIARLSGQPSMGRQAAEQLYNTPGVRLVDLDDQLAVSAAQIAADFRLRGADAVYVAVAARFNAPLITWDKEQLTRAAPIVAARTPDTDTP